MFPGIGGWVPGWWSRHVVEVLLEVRPMGRAKTPVGLDVTWVRGRVRLG